MSASNTRELNTKAASCDSNALTGDPFERLCYVFGQLLSAGDLTDEQSAIVLRRRLHQAALHGAGVTWGLGLAQRDDGRTLVVDAGLAVDALGRDIYVDREQCLDVRGIRGLGLWDELDDSPYLDAAEATEPAVDAPLGALVNEAVVDAIVEDSRFGSGVVDRGAAAAEDSGSRRAYVVLRYQGCKAEPAPALRATCRDADQALDYSRHRDSFTIELESKPPPCPHALVRDVVTSSAMRSTRPDGGEVATLRARIESLLTHEPGAALSELWANVDATAPVVLASVDLVEAEDGDLLISKVAAVDPSIRPLLPPVQLLGELLSGQQLACASEMDALRALQVTGEVESGSTTLRLHCTDELLPATAKLAVTLSRLDEGSGWVPLAPDVEVDRETLVITLKGEVWSDGTVYQLVVDGEGPTPLLTTNHQPLSGWADEPVPPLGRGKNASLTATWPPTEKNDATAI